MTKRVRIAIVDFNDQIAKLIRAGSYDAGIAVIHQALDEHDYDWFHLHCDSADVAEFAVEAGGREVQSSSGLWVFAFLGSPYVAFAKANCVVADLRVSKVIYLPRPVIVTEVDDYKDGDALLQSGEAQGYVVVFDPSKDADVDEWEQSETDLTALWFHMVTSNSELIVRAFNSGAHEVKERGSHRVFNFKGRPAEFLVGPTFVLVEKENNT